MRSSSFQSIFSSNISRQKKMSGDCHVTIRFNLREKTQLWKCQRILVIASVRTVINFWNCLKISPRLNLVIPRGFNFHVRPKMLGLVLTSQLEDDNTLSPSGSYLIDQPIKNRISKTWNVKLKMKWAFLNYIHSRKICPNCDRKKWFFPSRSMWNLSRDSW